MRYIITDGVPTGKTDGPVPGLVTAEPTPELDAAYAAYAAYVAGLPPPYMQPALAVRAAELLSDPAGNLSDDVSRFLGQVQALAQAGVTLPDPLTFRGLAAAIRDHWPDDLPQATATGLELRNAWDDIVYHCGTLKDADELFPFLVQELNNQV